MALENEIVFAGFRSPLNFAFRRPDPKTSDPDRPVLEKKHLLLAGIRCPLCRWRPESSSRWRCWDCDAPEYFYGGCGTAWNTFETRGRCPGCSHRWKWTSCLACCMWSRHDDWYE